MNSYTNDSFYENMSHQTDAAPYSVHYTEYAQQQGQKIADSQRILERRPVSADKHAQFGNAMHKHHDCYAQAQQQNAEVHTGVGGQGAKQAACG